MPQTTTLPTVKSLEGQRNWHHIDAEGQVLGRIATRIADLLRGKHKPIYSPHLDCGDFVVITNARKVRMTGNKEETKWYFKHSGYAGGGRNLPYKVQIERDPRKVVHLAVKRMIDDNRLRSKQLRRLKIYPAGENPFASRFEGK